MAFKLLALDLEESWVICLVKPIQVEWLFAGRRIRLMGCDVVIEGSEGTGGVPTSRARTRQKHAPPVILTEEEAA